MRSDRIPRPHFPASSGEPVVSDPSLDGLLSKADRFRVDAPAAPPRDWTSEVWLPQPFEPRYAYPLIVWLHDAGETELAAGPWADATGMQNALVLSVRGPVRRAGGGFDWPADGESVWAAVAEELADLPPELHFDAGRVFLCGAGRGAVAAFEAWRSNPGRVAGACLASPGVLDGSSALAGGRLGGRLWVGGFGASSWRAVGRAAFALGTEVRIDPTAADPHAVGPAIDHWIMRSIPTAVLA